jgi:hypothetical protein
MAAGNHDNRSVPHSVDHSRVIYIAVGTQSSIYFCSTDKLHNKSFILTFLSVDLLNLEMNSAEIAELTVTFQGMACWTKEWVPTAILLCSIVFVPSPPCTHSLLSL